MLLRDAMIMLTISLYIQIDSIDMLTSFQDMLTCSQYMVTGSQYVLTSPHYMINALVNVRRIMLKVTLYIQRGSIDMV
jgi:hypothetical protein